MKNNIAARARVAAVRALADDLDMDTFMEAATIFAKESAPYRKEYQIDAINTKIRDWLTKEELFAKPAK